MASSSTLAMAILALLSLSSVTGLSVKPRYEVQDFFSGKNKLQRDLFLQAFAAIEKLPVDDHRSFYQIAGIHGLPYEPYRGSVNEDYPWRESNESWGGYCHHSSVLFPTWHRAYMLLIERVLRDEALALAKQYNASLRDSYLAAAKSMRFPYWDWAANRVSKRGIPDIFRYRTVNVNVPPNANKKSITNPLRAFEAPLDIGTPQNCSKCDPRKGDFTPQNVDGIAGFYPMIPKGYKTFRQPNKKAKTQDSILQKSAKLYSQVDWKSGVFAMLHQRTWLKFSSNSATPFGSTNILWAAYYASLEAVHDAVHIGIGGWGGHMAYNQVAGFDPIFFFHHCNVDRLFALWQTANPDTYVTPGKSMQGTFTIPPNTEMDQNTPLTPFRKGDGSSKYSYYTSKDLRNIEELGYTYPELQKKISNRPSDFKKFILNMYKPSEDYYSTRWYVDLPEAKVENAPGPLMIRVFLQYIGTPTVETSVMSKHYAGTFFVWGKAPLQKRVDDVVELTPTMRRFKLSVDPVPFLTKDNDFSNVNNTLESVVSWTITKRVLDFVPVGLDGKDYSKYVTLGAPRIYFVREDVDTNEEVVKVVVPEGATYPVEAILNP